jgi:hypothetical protein
MEFLYPKFKNPTHTVNTSNSISIDYPISNTYRSKRDYAVPEGVQVAIVQENLGFKCEWSQVKVVDYLYESAEYFEKTFYILNENITNLTNKKSFIAVCNTENEIDISAQEIDPNLRDTFIPYIDKRNGLFSIRIQTDYEKILDSFLFDQVLQEVFYEGMSLLLASRGFRSDNDTITSFLNEYLTFGYINKDLDLTTIRPCEPLTFTVSLPLRFFNNFEPVTNEQEIVRQASKKIKFTNKNFVELINNILFVFKKKSADIFSLTYPNKFIENLSVDYEFLRIKNFAKTASRLFEVSGYPILAQNIINYEIGYEYGARNDLKIIYIKINTDNKEIYLNQAILSQFRLSGEFSSARIFNYLENISLMRRDIDSLDILDFLKKYVKYPSVNLIEEKITIAGEDLTPEKVKSYRTSFSDLKKCLNTKDLVNGVDEGFRLADTIYYLFIEDQQENSIPTAYETFKQNNPDLFEKTKESKNTNASDGALRRKYTTPEGNIVYYPELAREQYVTARDQISNEFYTQVGSLSNLSTLSYMLNRLNITKILMQHMFCYLRGLPTSSREAIELATRISPDIINYFTYLYNIRKVRGRQFAKLVAEGSKNFDINLFCTSNEQVIYFIKALSAISKGLNIIGTTFVSIQNQLANKPANNPYALLTNQIILTIQTALADSLTELMTEAFANSCEDDLLNPTDNFEDPFTTHIPIENPSGATNNNPTVVRNNTRNALDQTFSAGFVNNLTFGFDREYAVDLLQNLFNDIKCVLTPNEIIDLLKNKANDLTIIIIKNIIRNKYADDPNNLLFLAENDAALKLFFQKFGQTIDPVVIENIENTIGDANELIGTNLCKDEFADTRQKIIEGKLPPELGVLEEQISRRLKKARNIFEYVTNDTVAVNISGLCPDSTSSELDGIKDRILETYNDYINNLFSEVLISFNDNASSVSRKILDTRKVIVQEDAPDDDNPETRPFRIEEGKDYSVAFPTFSYNLDPYSFGVTLQQEDYKTGFREYKNSPEFTDKLAIGLRYVPDEQEVPFSTLLENSISRKESTNDKFVFCRDRNFKASDEFINYIENNAFYIEFVLENYFFDVSDSTEGDLDESRSLPLEDRLKFGPGIISELENKLYFISITVDSEGIGEDIIQFRLYRNTGTRYEAVGEPVKFQGPIEGYSFGGTDSLAVILKYIIRLQITGRTVGTLGNEGEIDSDRIYKLNFAKNEQGQYVLPFDPGRLYSNLLNDIFNLYFRDKIKELEKYSEILKLIDKFKKFGLYQNIFSFDPENDLFINKIFVSTTAEQNNIELREYLKVEIKPEEKDFFKNLHKSLIYSNIAQSNMISSERPPANNAFNRSLDYMFPRSIGSQLKIIGLDYTNYLKNRLIDLTLLSPENAQEAAAKYLDEEYKKRLTENFAKINLLNLVNDFKYKNCNVFPHYLNLDFFKQKAFNNAKEILCDDNISETPEDIIKEIIVNMTIRTFVTDILARGFIFFNVLSRETLEKLHKNTYFVKLITEFLKKELETFGTRQNNTTVYYNKFLNITEEIYDKYLQNGIIYGINNNNFNTIKKEFLNDTECLKNKEEKLIYFIRKEIRHFIYFSLTKNLIIPAEKDFFKEYSEEAEFRRDEINVENVLYALKDTVFNGDLDAALLDPLINNVYYTDRYNVGQLPVKGIQGSLERRSQGYGIAGQLFFNVLLSPFTEGDVQLRSLEEETQILIKNKYTEKFFEYYFYFLFGHFLMANTIDATKRNIFSSTKSELVSLVYQLIPFTEEEVAADPAITSITTVTKKQEDVVKFVRNLAYSPSPAALINLAPDYSKYIDFYLRATLSTTRTILLNVAQATDINIAVTRTINSAITSINSIAWSLTDPETRNRLIVESNDAESVFLFKRLQDGRSLIPDFALSLALNFSPFSPVKYTSPSIAIAYLIVDTISEGVYTVDSFEEIRKLKELYEKNTAKPLQPCEVPPKPAITEEQVIKCTPDIQKDLRNQVDAFEELPKNKEEIITKQPLC